MTESQGQNPLLSKNSSVDGAERRLSYWATLMRSWVRGDPLSRVIANSISYYSRRGFIEYRDFSRTDSLVSETFNPNSAKHINIVIEETLRDIEGGLRFRIIAYLQNFYDISVLALGQENSGLNVATLVEYGTIDGRAIELQEVGFSRGVATELLRDFADCLHFSSSAALDEIDEDALLAQQGLSDEARKEVTSILVKSSPASPVSA